ncbi:A24 family peptidase [Streptomyces swartbergensis]|uniref:A24 family peptidase n=1 Tax=Streptomyces swartbergensis TaxID=487165 RepID=UPI00117C2FD0|nr:A24 family peptidase [Streptomyces swartbergensis]
MTTPRRRIFWSCVTTGAIFLVIGCYFAYIGLEDADKLASVLGFFVGSLGLAIAAFAAFYQRGNQGTTQSAGTPGQPENEPRPESDEHTPEGHRNIASQNHFHNQAAMNVGDNTTQTNHWGQSKE